MRSLAVFETNFQGDSKALLDKMISNLLDWDSILGVLGFLTSTSGWTSVNAMLKQLGKIEWFKEVG